MAWSSWSAVLADARWVVRALIVLCALLPLLVVTLAPGASGALFRLLRYDPQLAPARHR